MIPRFLVFPEIALSGVLAISRSYKPLSTECVSRCLVEVTFALQNLVARYRVLESDNAVPIVPISVPIVKVDPQIDNPATTYKERSYGHTCVALATFLRIPAASTIRPLARDS